jgi:hypothetical protein
MTDQALPFHVSTKVLPGTEGLEYSPTATQDVALLHDTLESELLMLPGEGLGMTDQAVPFHTSVSV